MVKVPLHCVPRVFYAVYLIKLALCVFSPSLALEYIVDYCPGCSGEPDILGKAWGSWVVQAIPAGLYLGISCSNENDSVLRRYMQFGLFLPIIRMFILGYASIKGLVHQESTSFYIGMAENGLLTLFTILSCYVWNCNVGIPTVKDKNSNKGNFWSLKCVLRIVIILTFINTIYISLMFFGQLPKIGIMTGGGVVGEMYNIGDNLFIIMMLFAVQRYGDISQKHLCQWILVLYILVIYYIDLLRAPEMLSTSTALDSWRYIPELGLISASLDYLALSKHLVDINAVIGVCLSALFKISLLLHAMWVIYPTNKRRAAFWFAALALAWLSCLGLFHDSATASAIYRLPELTGSTPGSIFTLIGVLMALLSQGCMSIASCNNTETFEKGIVSITTGLFLCLFLNKSLIGIFGELLGIFYLWCLWFQYGKNLKTNGFKMPTVVSCCLGMFTGKGAPGSSSSSKSPTAGGGKRSRSRTPGRKNK